MINLFSLRAVVQQVTAALTWGGRLDLGLERRRLLGVCGRPQGLGRRLLPALHFALVGKQVLDVLLLQRAGRAAGRPHVQLGRQLPPLLVFIHLRQEGETGLMTE